MRLLKNMKNIVYCYYNSYKYFEDYLSSFLRHINCELLLYTTYQGIVIDKDSRNIFVQTIPEKILDTLTEQDNIYLINTEQMCRTYDDWKDRINNYPPFVNMIDFSKENLKYYKRLNSFWIPYQVNIYDIYNFTKDLGVCIMASGEGNLPEYRKKIYDQIQEKGLNISLIQGWSKKRDEKLMRHKIIINLGYTSCAKIMEQIRCNRCVLNKMIVVSDRKIDEDYILGKYIIFEDYENIANKVVEVYNNYEKYYNQLFSNFDDSVINEIDEYQSPYLSILE